MYNGQFRYGQNRSQQGSYGYYPGASYIANNYGSLQNRASNEAQQYYGKASNSGIDWSKDDFNQDDFNPDPQLPTYSGPYPMYDLQRARSSLIESLKRDSSDILQRIKPRLGITSCYGPATIFKLPNQPVNAPDESTSSQYSQSTQITQNVQSTETTQRKRTASSSASSSTSTCQTEEKAQPTTQQLLDNIRAKAVEERASKLTVSNTTKTASASSASTSSTTAAVLSDVADSLWERPAPVESINVKRKSDSTESEEPPMKKKKDTPIMITANNQIYKCDFCQTQNHSRDAITSHLNQAKHFSASLYTTKDSKLVAVEKKLAVRQKHVKNDALVVVCPSCHDIFEDIFMCGLHYKFTHGGDSHEGNYSVTPVIHTENVVISTQPICQHCDTTFEKMRLLHKHWDTQKSHIPLSKQVPDTAFAIFSCLYCDKTFYGNFLACKSHAIEHKIRDGPVCALKARYILKPMRTEELLPVSTSSALDGLDDEMSMLKNMKKHFQSISGTKQKISAINKRMEYLKQFKG